MDKGLIILNELKKELENLKANYDVVIFEKEETSNELMILNGGRKKLELNLRELKDKEIILKEAPQKLKEYKKKIIKLYFFGFSLFSVILSILLTFISIKNNLGTLYILENSAQLLVGGSLISTLMGIFDYSNKQEKYKVGNLEEINKEINEKTDLLEFTKNKINELQQILADLKSNQEKLSDLINIINDKINSIEKIRTEIIETYCKDNKELDDLLDNAYDEKIEGKQKTKNSNK